MILKAHIHVYELVNPSGVPQLLAECRSNSNRCGTQSNSSLANLTAGFITDNIRAWHSPAVLRAGLCFDDCWERHELRRNSCISYMDIYYNRIITAGTYVLAIRSRLNITALSKLVFVGMILPPHRVTFLPENLRKDLCYSIGGSPCF